MTQLPSSGTTNGEVEVTGLVKKAAGGDINAFGDLYGIYLDRIYRYVYHQVRDRMTAEDITEEVFIKAWRAIKSCRGKEPTFTSWLYRIAHNCVVDDFRSRRKHQSLETENLIPTGDCRQELEVKQDSQRLAEIISTLPEQQRQVIILKFMEGLDNGNIGQVMGKSQGSIRVLQTRALATLRQRLNRDKEK